MEATGSKNKFVGRKFIPSTATPQDFTCVVVEEAEQESFEYTKYPPNGTLQPGTSREQKTRMLTHLRSRWAHALAAASHPAVGNRLQPSTLRRINKVPGLGLKQEEISQQYQLG